MNTKTFHFELKVKEGDSGELPTFKKGWPPGVLATQTVEVDMNNVRNDEHLAHALIQTSDTFLAKIIEVKISETQEDETTTENG